MISVTSINKLRTQRVSLMEILNHICFHSNHQLFYLNKFFHSIELLCFLFPANIFNFPDVKRSLMSFRLLRARGALQFWQTIRNSLVLWKLKENIFFVFVKIILISHKKVELSKPSSEIFFPPNVKANEANKWKIISVRRINIFYDYTKILCQQSRVAGSRNYMKLEIKRNSRATSAAYGFAFVSRKITTQPFLRDDLHERWRVQLEISEEWLN